MLTYDHYILVMIATRTRTTTAAVLLLSAVGVTLVLLTPFPSFGQWQVRLLDLGHIPLFAVLTVGCGWLLGGKRYALVVLGLTVFAAGIELIQDRFERSGNFPDLVRSEIGIVIGLLMVAMARRRSLTFRAFCGITIAGLVIVPVYLASDVLLEAVDSYRRFPTIVDFRREWQMTDFVAYGATIERIPWVGHPGQFLGQVRCQAGKTFAGVVLTPVQKDWRGYRRLNFQIIGSDPPIPVTLTIKDDRPVHDYHERFNFTKAFGPGVRLVQIDLMDVAAGPKTMPLDLSSIGFLNFFCSNATSERTFYLVKVWLD